MSVSTDDTKKTNFTLKPDEEERLFTLPDLKPPTDSTEAARSKKDDGDENEEDDIDTGDSPSKEHLVEDGVVVEKTPSVISATSKVGTEFSRKKVVDDEDLQSKVGRKRASGKGTGEYSLQSIRRKFGFSWKKYGRKITLFILVFGIIGVLATSFVAAWLIDQYDEAASVASLSEPGESSVVYARDGKTVLFKFFGEEKREIVELCNDDIPLEKQGNCIPKQMQLAMIALEDENFYYNENGIPWKNLAGAVSKCLITGGDDCRGASGLSQQLVKNLTGDDEFSVDRKVRELFTAMKLNQETTHTEILRMYLNTVPFGRNAYGVQEASKSYFEKDIKKVSTSEACYLASLVQEPTTYSTSIEKKDTKDVDSFGAPWVTHWERFEGRKNACLAKLHEEELEPDNPSTFIQTEEELNTLQEAEVEFAPNKNIFKYPHFTDYVKEELKKIIPERDLYTRGYSIVTTIDPKIQENTEKIVKNRINSNVLANGADNTAALVLNNDTGEILAMVGSRDYNNNDIDGKVNITTSPQQAGSTMKPYVYATALSKDFNPGTVILDKVTNFGGGYKPTNYGGNTGYGLVSLRYALQNSLNISAVKAAAYSAGGGGYDPSAGIGEVFNFSEKVGLEFPCIPSADGKKCDNPEMARKAYRDRCFLSSALGACEITMLSHATGINTLLNDGNLRTANPFIKIETKNDEQENKSIQERLSVLYPKKDKAIDPLIARQVANIMSDYNARLVFGQYRSNLELGGWSGSNAVAAKTGTSNDVRDVWTVGGTPYYTVTVWVGNTDNSPMNSTATSSNAAGGIWKEIMTNLHTGKEPKGFSREGLQSYPVNCAGARSGWCRGTELMTQDQIRALQGAQQRMTKEDYNPLESDIFDFRDAAVKRTIRVNKLDGKLALKDTPEAFLEEKECVQVLSGFPKVSGWYEPAKTFQGAAEFEACPVEKTEIKDDIQEMTLTANLTDGGEVTSTITAEAMATQPGGTMKWIKLVIDGKEVATGVENLAYNAQGSGFVGSLPVEIIARDSYDQEKKLTYTLDFNYPLVPVTSPSQLSVACSAVDAGEDTTCTTTPDAGYSLPSGSYEIRIGAAGDVASCTTSSCTARTPAVPGSLTVYVRIGGSSWHPKSQVVLS